MGTRLGALKARQYGAGFEDIFKKHCQMQGVAVRKKNMQCRYVGNRFQVLKGELDFEVLKDGQTAHVDTKTIDAEIFTSSMIKREQAVLANWYHENGVKSGYVIWFRPVNVVAFFSGDTLINSKQRKFLHWSHGEYMGRYEDICVGNLFVWT